MYIDGHVHLRDFKQSHKETIKHGLEVARDSGVDAVFDMPNTNPQIIDYETVYERLKLAKNACVPEVFYGLYIGLTNDKEQVKKATDITREFSQVVGMKLYAGHSVGRMGVTKIDDQAAIYQTLSKEGYYGVLAVHCEKESEIREPQCLESQPINHCFARPEIAEIESVRDQLMLAKDYNFKGKLHITHISSPKAVELVKKAKIEGVDISCAICPYHLFYDFNMMDRDDGLFYKMNPPLRNQQSKRMMLEYLKMGDINFIETDHAPHTLEEKTKTPFMSGIPGLPWWPLFEECLKKEGFNDEQIEKITFSNIQKRFEIEIKKSRRKLKDRTNDYSFNPYKPLEEWMKII